MHDVVRSQNLYVCSILTLGNENLTVSDSGQAENLKGEKNGGMKRGGERTNVRPVRLSRGGKGGAWRPLY
jgi:hypothetical protein